MTAKLLVVLIYAVVLVVVLFVPATFLDEKGRAPWWRNVRFWAALVALVQMGVYAVWG